MQVIGDMLTFCASLTVALLYCASAQFTGTEMPCKDPSPSACIPTSVHKLRPGDIKVVAALGDSFTAGNGIASSPSNILDVLEQYRGLSWSIGGDGNLTTVTTLPNILRYFNGKLRGYSVGVGTEDTVQAYLNQAVAGAKTKDILSQARTLVARMKNDPMIHFQSDWKVITIFIGGNDLCDHCNEPLLYSAENYMRHLRNTLDYLQKEVPRVLVNLVEILYTIPLREMLTINTHGCPLWLTKFICPCVLSPKPKSQALHVLEELNRSYQHMTHKLVESGRYDARADFTVVVQPFFREVSLPKLPDGSLDRSFFSADCFHLSQKSHTVMARALWNNMLEPLGNKSTVRNFSAPVTLTCPTKASPYLGTHNNSINIHAGTSRSPGLTEFYHFIFSKINSLPSPPVITTAAAPDMDIITTGPGSVPGSASPLSMPVWVPVIVGVASMLAGITAAWVILSCCQHRKNKVGGETEMKNMMY